MIIHYTISNDIFARFPEYRRGVVVAEGVKNGRSPDELIARLRLAEGAISSSPLHGMKLTAETITAHPRIAAWREAYRALGVKPSDFRPSVEALARRAMKGEPLPPISRIVDLGNLVSLENLVPIGAHAIDVLHQDIELRLASGKETFEPFGADIVENPLPEEVIFVEGNTVLTRRWTWRQAKHTLVTDETTAVEINVDGLPPVTEGDVRQICEELAELLVKLCGGKANMAVLSRDNPRIKVVG